jgi:hypothetical protein
MNITSGSIGIGVVVCLVTILYFVRTKTQKKPVFKLPRSEQQLRDVTEEAQSKDPETPLAKRSWIPSSDQVRLHTSFD